MVTADVLIVVPRQVIPGNCQHESPEQAAIHQCMRLKLEYSCLQHIKHKVHILEVASVGYYSTPRVHTVSTRSKTIKL